MRRFAALLAVILAAPLLSGCVYNPYTGTFVPCCSYYGYPYYRYPPPYYPYGYPPGPYMAQPQVQPGGYSGQPQGEPGGHPSQPQGGPGAYPSQPQGEPGTYPYPSQPPSGQPPSGQPTPLSRPGAANSPQDDRALGPRFAAANVTLAAD